jgi:hypothetical protein
MSERLTRFLAELAKDPRKAEALWEDLETSLAGADLTEEEKEIIRSGDVEKLRSMTGVTIMSSISTVTRPKPTQTRKPTEKPET